MPGRGNVGANHFPAHLTKRFEELLRVAAAAQMVFPPRIGRQSTDRGPRCSTGASVAGTSDFRSAGWLEARSADCASGTARAHPGNAVPPQPGPSSARRACEQVSIEADHRRRIARQSDFQFRGCFLVALAQIQQARQSDARFDQRRTHCDRSPIQALRLGVRFVGGRNASGGADARRPFRGVRRLFAIASSIGAPGASAAP